MTGWKVENNNMQQIKARDGVVSPETDGQRKQERK